MNTSAVGVEPHATSCVWFWVWAGVGFTGALGIVSFGLGPLVGLPAVAAAVLLARHEAARRSAFGVVTGAGLLLLIVAWVQRDGPGTTCWQTANASGCDQHLNPLPWLIAGLLLCCIGAGAHRRLMSRGSG